MFTKTMFVGWGDMDFNGHMRNTTFLDRSGDSRLLFFHENGFSVTDLYRLRIGPIILKDEISYYRELVLLENFTIELRLSGMTEDGARFVFRNDFYKSDRTHCCRVVSTGGWLDLDKRRLSAPPTELIQAMQKLERTNDFTLLKSKNSAPG